MYKLADGSLSTDYKIGDEFEVVLSTSDLEVGDVVIFHSDDGDSAPWFELPTGLKGRVSGVYCCSWSRLKPHRKQFTKADLKDGMVVTYRNGCSRLIFDDGLYDVDGGKAKRKNKLGSLRDNMTDAFYTISSGLDIMKVSYMGETLWEREEETAEQKEIKRLRGVIEDAQKALSKLESE